jgi:hypothetical protein
MRNLLYIAALSISLWSCGGGGDNPAPVNNAPTTPSLVAPTNNLLCIDNPVTCQWSASTDKDGDVITYQIEVAKNSAFTLDKQTFNSQLTTQLVSLEEDIAYYWRVKATDGEASSGYSSVFKFYTYGEGTINYLPFSPELVAPELNSVVQTPTANLQWTADDVDTADTLTYDVYFGTDPTPVTLKSENQSATSFETDTLAASTTYYWKVVVNDGQGGQTIGQVWRFTTD